MAEGVFPKADGDLLYSRDVNLVNSSQASALLRTQLSHYGNSLMYNPLFHQEQFLSDVATTATNLTYKTVQYEYVASSSDGAFTFETPMLKFDSAVTELIGGVDYEVFEYYDLFSGSTVSSTLWPTSTNCTQTAGLSINFVAGSNCQLVSKDISGSSGGQVLRVSGYFLANTFGPDSTRSITFRLTDETNDQNIVDAKSRDEGGGTSYGVRTYWTATFHFDWDDSKVRWNVKEDKTRLGHMSGESANGWNPTDVQMSSGSLNFSSWSSMKLEIQSVGGDQVSGTLREVKYIKTSPTLSPTFSASSDNGTTYLESVNGAPVKLSTTDDEVMLKLTGTATGDEVIGIKAFYVKKLS